MQMRTTLDKLSIYCSIYLNSLMNSFKKWTSLIFPFEKQSSSKKRSGGFESLKIYNIGNPNWFVRHVKSAVQANNTGRWQTGLYKSTTLPWTFHLCSGMSEIRVTSKEDRGTLGRFLLAHFCGLLQTTTRQWKNLSTDCS